MIGRTNTGGGGGLNFRVIGGTSLPANPKTNDIWVNTSVEIPEWTFTTDNPFVEEIYSKGTVEQGFYIKIDTGAEHVHELYSTLTVKLPVGTQTITVPAYGSTTSVAHAFYDANGGLISTVQRLTGAVTYDVPSGAVMARVSFYQDDATSVIATRIPPEGAVWFITSESSVAEFNSLKKNNISVYPYHTKQYVNSEWVTVSASIYGNYGWINIWNGILYDAGDEYDYVTGGWHGQNLMSESTVEDGSLTKGSSYMTVTTASGSSFGAVINNALNFKKYTTLHVLFTGHMRLSISDQYPELVDNYIAVVTPNKATAKTEATLTIPTGIDDGVFCGIGNRSAAEPLYIYKVWLT